MADSPTLRQRIFLIPFAVARISRHWPYGRASAKLRDLVGEFLHQIRVSLLRTREHSVELVVVVLCKTRLLCDDVNYMVGAHGALDDVVNLDSGIARLQSRCR